MSDQEYQWLTFEIETDGKQAKYVADPNMVCDLVAGGIKKQIAGEITDDMTEVEKNLVRATRMTVKGVFVAFGGKILDIVFKSKDHPKPQKGDDLIEWYSNIFAQLWIAQATQGVLTLKGRYSDGEIVIIDEISPISLAGGAGGTGTGESQGSPDGEGLARLERV